MISGPNAIQDAVRFSDVLKGSGITMPNSSTSRIVDKAYSGEQNFPMMGSDWLFSLEALALVGKSMFGEQWDRAEFDALWWPTAPVEAHRTELSREKLKVESRKHLPISLASNDFSRQESLVEFEAKKEADLQRLIKSAERLPTLVGIQQRMYEKNRAALDRLTKAAKWLGDKCRSADINTGYGALDHLPIADGHSYSWNCVSDLQHWVKDGSLEICMTSARKIYRCKAYACRSDLEREIRTLAHSESIVSETDLSRLPPYLKFAVDLALAQNWLIDGKHESKPVREAEIEAKWANAFPHIELTGSTKAAIAKVLSIPDVEATNRSAKAPSKSNKK